MGMMHGGMLERCDVFEQEMGFILNREFTFEELDGDAAIMAYQLIEETELEPAYLVNLFANMLMDDWVNPLFSYDERFASGEAEMKISNIEVGMFQDQVSMFLNRTFLIDELLPDAQELVYQVVNEADNTADAVGEVFGILLDIWNQEDPSYDTTGLDYYQLEA